MSTHYEREAVRLAADCRRLALENARLRGRLGEGMGETRNQVTWLIVGEPENQRGEPIGIVMSQPAAHGEASPALYNLSLERAKRLAADLQAQIRGVEVALGVSA